MATSISNSITNRKNTPAVITDVLANRPETALEGTIFIVKADEVAAPIAADPYTEPVPENDIFQFEGGEWVPKGGGGSFGGIKNQYDAAQAASFWISGPARIGGNVIFEKVISVGSLNADPTTASNGDIFYSTALGKMRFYEAGVWKSIMAEGAVGYIKGKVITVDKDALNATDNRVGISKYNSFYPFKTIAAAAAVLADGDVLYIASGVYSGDSLIVSNTAFANAVYMDAVTLTGDIQMKGKLFLTNTTINGVITFVGTGGDIPSGNMISGLDKGSSVINGKIVVTSTPGANYLTIRHLGRITTPASGTASGRTFSGTNTQLFADGISKIENLGTTTGLTAGSMAATFTNIGAIVSEITTNAEMFSGGCSFKNVDLVEYKGTGAIAGGYQSSLKYAENSIFKVTASTFIFGTYGGGAATFTLRNCFLINSLAGGYIFRAASGPTGGPNKTKEYYIYSCQFQCNNNSGANYLFQVNNDDLNIVHLINCISNQNGAIYWIQNGAIAATAPTIEIVGNYQNNPAFVLKQPPIYN